MQCAHRNLRPEPSRQPRLDPKKNTDIEEHEIRYRSTKASIKYTDTVTEGAFVDIDVSSISVYNDIEVLNFDIDVSSISYCVDIKVPGFDIEGSSISYWIDIEWYNLRYRRFSELGHSIIECQPSISSCNIVSDIKGHFPTFDILGCTFNIVI
jgi:hypothetical protein